MSVDQSNDRNEDGPVVDAQGGDRPTAAKTPRQRGPRWMAILAGIVALPLLLLASWIFLALHWHYSEGNRAGYIQKFSQKGWLCKTWEGELAMVNLPGAAQERFLFSVRDDSVAKEITRHMGGHVSLTYEEHRGVPTSCFGDTQYFVKSVEQLP